MMQKSLFISKPVDNVFIESFNRAVREEYLNDNWFISLSHAIEIVQTWRVDCNANRQHSYLKCNDIPHVIFRSLYKFGFCLLKYSLTVKILKCFPLKNGSTSKS
ncbi:MAG: transposase [Bacteroidetes bacterium]|nr:transposase [Bacteroidota bacterium]